MKSIGIDIGTTTLSAVVYENNQIFKSKTVESLSFIKSKDEDEKIQDVDIIISKAKRMLDEFIEEYNDISFIGLTGQMHGVVYLDENGKHISPLYTWQDGRGNRVENNISLVEKINNQYHLNVASGYGLVTYLYNLKYNKHASSICTIMDYFGMVLTQRKKPLMHVSNAASFGFFDLEKLCFYDDILKDLGIDLSVLPEVTNKCVEIGKYKGIAVSVAIGDNQASFLGTVGYEENTLLFNMGTGGQVSIISNEYKKIPGIDTRPFINGKYLYVGASLCGGRAYAILEKFFESYVKIATGIEMNQYSIMEDLAKKGMESSHVRVNTTFLGSRENPSLKGSINEIDENNFTPESFIYGLLEGMAKELFDMYQLIYENTGIEVKRIIGSGNGIRKNEVLQNIVTSMFNAKLEMSSYLEEAAIGASKILL